MTTTIDDAALRRIGVSPTSAARLLARAEGRRSAVRRSPSEPTGQPVFYTKGHIDRLVAVARELGYVRD